MQIGKICIDYLDTLYDETRKTSPVGIFVVERVSLTNAIRLLTVELIVHSF